VELVVFSRRLTVFKISETHSEGIPKVEATLWDLRKAVGEDVTYRNDLLILVRRHLTSYYFWPRLTA
jgi:hypothetical protein